MSLQSLPPEILTLIYSYLPTFTAVHDFSATSSLLRQTYNANALAIIPNVLYRADLAAPEALPLVQLQESKDLISHISSAWGRGLAAPQPLARRTLRQIFRNAKVVQEVADFAMQFGYLDWRRNEHCPLHLACGEVHERERWNWAIYTLWYFVLAHDMKGTRDAYMPEIEALKFEKKALILNAVVWICEGHLWIMKPLLDTQLQVVTSEWRRWIGSEQCVPEATHNHVHKPEVEKAWMELRIAAKRACQDYFLGWCDVRTVHAACWVDEKGCQYARGERDVWDLDASDGCRCTFFG